MSADQFAKQIETILRDAADCTTVEVCIVSNKEAETPQPGYFIGISAYNSIEVDKIQSVMTMTGAKFEKWTKDQDGELMVYFVPIRII